MESTSSSQPAGTKIEPVGKITITSSTDGKLISNSARNLSTDHLQPHLWKISASYAPLDYQVKQAPENNSSIQSSSLVMNIFTNKDVPENYYSIAFPQSGMVIHGYKSGDIIYRFGNVTSSVELQDIPDDSNVELYTLTHTEPALKLSLPNYKLISSGQLSAGGNRAWDIIYTWKNSTQDLETIKAFVEGKDQAAVFSFTSPIKDYSKNNSTINSILENFKWLGE